jgi:hypothetical protein
MKKSFLLFLLLTTTAAWANPKLKQNIANSLDALLSDTVNEGEMTAWVSEVAGKPQMTCELSRSRQTGLGLAKCDISIDIESQYTGENETCSSSCFVVYLYRLSDLTVVRAAGDTEDKCIENLSSGCD